jgi:3alpha(or 20beta)-hydroxysteroid dehydrogenase
MVNMSNIRKDGSKSRLEGKVAIISGGARGMGAADARLFVSEGAKVVIGDLLDTEGEKVATELGENIRYVHLDVTEPSGWANAVETAEHEFGSINILVNNAGIVNYALFEEYTIEQFRKTIEVNLFGTFLGIKAVIPSMKKSGSGSIINISSVAGLSGYPQLSGYVASKWGVRGLTKTAALDLSKYSIRVNSVHPGLILTPMTAGIEIEPDQVAMNNVAMNRAGLPEEIANVVLFLASDESSYITGAELVADGGASVGLQSFSISTFPLRQD